MKKYYWLFTLLTSSITYATGQQSGIGDQLVIDQQSNISQQNTIDQQPTAMQPLAADKEPAVKQPLAQDQQPKAVQPLAADQETAVTQPAAQDQQQSGNQEKKITTNNKAKNPQQEPYSPYMEVEFKVGYFRPTSSVLRDIYSGGAIYAFEYDVTVWKGLTVFTEGDYFVKHGRSIGESNKTKLQIGGYSFGLQYDFSIVSWLDFYVGLGPKFFFFRSTDHNPNVRKYTSKNDVGVIGKAGFYWLIPKNFYIDTFVEYSYCRMHFKAEKNKPVIPFNLDVGGLSAGGGVGYRF